VCGVRAQDAKRSTPEQQAGDAASASVQALARQHIDSARLHLERKEIETALPHIEQLSHLMTQLGKTQQTQHAEINRQQEEIYQLRQDYQLLLGKYELMTMQHEVNYNWLKLERDKKSERAALEEKDRQLNAERLQTEAFIRYALIAAGAVSLLIGFLVFRRMQDRRRAVEMKAEIAEARATALEADKRRGEYEARKRFTRQLIDSQEQERKRIAADLHDGLGQDLLVIKNRITLARREKDRGGDLTHELDEIMTAVTSSLQDIRRISRNLRPAQLDRLGLTSTLDSMFKTVRDSTGIEMQINIDMIDGLFSKEREIDIYRIVQESINNIVKHAEATKVRVAVTRRDDEVVFSIHDDGKGFPVEETRTSKDSTRQGIGLQGMSERAEFLDGILHITSSAGDGSTVTLTLPIPIDTHQE
jgi:signal transduction histidine kinase